MPSLNFALLAVAAVAVASFTQGVTGFGFGMVAMAILPYVEPARQASVLSGILSLANNLLVLGSVHRSFSWRDLAPALVGALAGVPVGVYILASLNEASIRRLIGLAVLLACLQIAFSRRSQPRHLAWPWALAAGFAGGILGGAFGIGGPPVVAYSSLQDWQPERCKAFLCSFFIASNTYRMVLVGAAGLLTRVVATQAVMSLPALLAGTYLGIAAFGRIPARLFRQVMLGTLALLALSLLFF